ncbi:Galactinol synthase 2 [Capsicum annuum]|nr:Galactinol synthase 2 [Capsicum annuum]
MFPDVPVEHRHILINQGCIVREIEPVYPLENQTQFAMAYYVINYPKFRIWDFMEYSKMIYLDGDIQCPDKVQWPKEKLGTKPSLYFNSGMFVFKPNFSTYNDLLRTLRVTPSTSFAEQDLLNMFFKDIYKPIPNKYNLVLAMLWRHPENVQADKVKVVHYYAAGSKPWR